MKHTIFDVILGDDERSRVISIIGTAKNTGKTVTLNYMIQEAKKREIPLGLTSTGRDGEEWDALYSHFKKPAVYIHKNTIFTTTEEIWGVGGIKATAVEKTRFRTSLGNVLILKAEEDGNVEIAGPQTNTGIREVSDCMLKKGVELVLVDGAVNRKSASSTAVADGVILSTGAAYDGNMMTVISDTAGIAGFFNLSVPDDPTLIDFAEKAFSDRHITIINTLGAFPLGASLTSNGALGANIKEHRHGPINHIVFPGALMTETIDTIETILGDISGILFIVKEASNLFIEPGKINEIREKGADIMVMRPAKLKLITVNPVSPVSQAFPKDIFLSKMKDAVPFAPVVDVLSLKD